MWRRSGMRVVRRITARCVRRDSRRLGVRIASSEPGTELMTVAAAPTRPVNILVFSGLCLATALAWDVGYALICDHLGRTVTDRLPPWSGLASLLGVPVLLCFAV